ncbi:MAG TPA: CPBP family intramembrane glutamic endopeptidase [Thermoanaerobaculia bacterium]|nr:CPBP family intramembrane glutamic endopeptidase [Thermoanaerobaculia bacterium]
MIAASPPEAQAVQLARTLLPALPALLAAWAVDRLCAVRGLSPPGFRQPGRRAIAFAALAFVLWVGVFAPLGMIGLAAVPDLAGVSTPRLFLLHGLMVGATLLWLLAGFAGLPAAPPGPPPIEAELPGPQPARNRPPLLRLLGLQLGLAAPDVPREIGLGLAIGLGAWVVVLGALVVLALLLFAFGAEGLVPKEPPALIPWIAALPFGVRLLLSLSAGFVEEGFFRGFLQPRVGILLSTFFFVLAHASYGQPFMLVGIAILSLIYGNLVQWRQNIWPAIAAHALFDGVQLLVIIPAALKLMGGHLPAAALLGL